MTDTNDTSETVDAVIQQLGARKKWMNANPGDIERLRRAVPPTLQTGHKEALATFIGMPVYLDSTIPRGEIHVVCEIDGKPWPVQIHRFIFNDPANTPPTIDT